jgi:Flp pilus assembly pilin Flp
MKHTISTFANILAEEQGQDIAEYAVMLAVILVMSSAQYA